MVENINLDTHVSTVLSRSFPLDVSILYSCWPAGCCLGTRGKNFSWLPTQVCSRSNPSTCDLVILLLSVQLNANPVPSLPMATSSMIEMEGEPPESVRTGAFCIHYSC